MISAEYVQKQLESVQSGEPSPAKVRDYALLCVALEHLQGTSKTVVAPLEMPTFTVESMTGKSEFLTAVSGKDSTAAWGVIDEHMEALKIMNNRAYNKVLDKIKRL